MTINEKLKIHRSFQTQKRNDGLKSCIMEQPVEKYLANPAEVSREVNTLGLRNNLGSTRHLSTLAGWLILSSHVCSLVLVLHLQILRGASFWGSTSQGLNGGSLFFTSQPHQRWGCFTTVSLQFLRTLHAGRGQAIPPTTTAQSNPGCPLPPSPTLALPAHLSSLMAESRRSPSAGSAEAPPASHWGPALSVPSEDSAERRVIWGRDHGREGESKARRALTRVPDGCPSPSDRRPAGTCSSEENQGPARASVEIRRSESSLTEHPSERRSVRCWDGRGASAFLCLLPIVLTSPLHTRGSGTHRESASPSRHLAGDFEDGLPAASKAHAFLLLSFAHRVWLLSRK